MATKPITLRHPDECVACRCAVPAGAKAWWDTNAKSVTCSVCRPGTSVPPPGMVRELASGGAGSSADREHRRRRESREARVREAHPHIGGLLLALTATPQHETAFARGAEGERKVAAALERRIADGPVTLLHDRRMPGGRGNIDHLAVAPSGVYVIDAKAHQGKVRIVRPLLGDEQLLIGGRDWSRLLDGLDCQEAAVREVLDGAKYKDARVHGILCFTNADLPWLRTTKMRGHLLVYGRALAKKLNTDGALTAETVNSVARTLAVTLPLRMNRADVRTPQPRARGGLALRQPAGTLDDRVRST